MFNYCDFGKVGLLSFCINQVVNDFGCTVRVILIMKGGLQIEIFLGSFANTVLLTVPCIILSPFL